MKTNYPAKAFIAAGLGCLSFGILLGLTAGIQYVIPGFLKDSLAFFQTRPMHTLLVTGWIFLTAIGIIYHVLCENKIEKYLFLTWLHFGLFSLTGIMALGAYLLKQFGGREYLEYPPVLSIPLLLSWLIFAFNFFKIIYHEKKKQPVYIWMWGTGILFFILTFIEAHLWLFPWFRQNIIRELTIQWKSYGALTGSWNMLVYGIALWLMAKMKNDARYARSGIAFALYFLGLTNLMFGWGHHTYPVPAAPWIREIAYLVSMSELLILGKIIFDFSKNSDENIRNENVMAFRMIKSADFWVFFNLVLALIISVPYFNQFTHGTHITVAHAMGTTIGINTFILFSALFYMKGKATSRRDNFVRISFYILNFSLALFLFSFIMAGIEKSWWQFHHPEITFRQMQSSLWPWFATMLVAGTGLVYGLGVLVAKIVGGKN